MSRCFPFPPPGYEKKPRPVDDDLLKKEKQKEKKDKEKKESKRKRDKEKSDGKHKEKKDRREKNKDRKRDKEKDKEKDQEKGSSITVEKRVPGKLEVYNGSKLQQKEKEWGKEICSTSEDWRPTGKLEGYNGQKLHNKVEESRDKRNISSEKKSVVQFHGHSEGKTFNGTFMDNNFEHPKFVVGFDRRVADEGTGTAPHCVEEFVGMGWKKDEGMGRFSAAGTSMAVESKENNKNKRVASKMDEHRTVYEGNVSGGALAENLPGSIQNKVSVLKPMEKIDRRMEGKEKEREVEDKQGDKHKSKDKETHSQGKDKNREKETKNREKAKETKEHKKSEKDKTKSSNKSDPNDTIYKTFHLSKESEENAAKDGNLKRKDIAKNGFLHADTYRPEKMPKLVSHSLPENGKKLEPSQTSVTLSLHRAGATNNVKVLDKDPRVNGFIGAQKMPVSVPKPVIPEASKKPPDFDTKYLNEVIPAPKPVIPEASKKPPDFDTKYLNEVIPAPKPVIPEASKKPPDFDSKYLNEVIPAPKPVIPKASKKLPHPDTKYLNKVLSVPQMDEWSGSDDQEWLFDNRSSVLKRSDIGSGGVDPDKHVWAEALRMESAETYALPYVIPY